VSYAPRRWSHGARALAATVGPVTDDLGVVRIAKGAPVQIGGYWVVSADTHLEAGRQTWRRIAFQNRQCLLD
jgi:branched-chain amino acid transport system substrate-binding protein